MKKFSILAIVLTLFVFGLTGCSSSYSKVDESTIFVQKKGEIIATDVEAFDEDVYDKEKLEEYVKDRIKEYTADNGKNTVKFKKLIVKDGVAKLILEYKSAEDYMKFNGIEIFTGTVEEALEKGYSFDTQFAQIDDGEATPCEASDVIDESDMKIIIIKANMNINVKGKVKFVSAANTSYIDKNTIAIQSGTNILTDYMNEMAETEDTTEGTENTEDSGSIDEGEISTEEESTEIVFEFEEEVVETEFASVYTYIIYE